MAKDKHYVWRVWWKSRKYYLNPYCISLHQAQKLVERQGYAAQDYEIVEFKVEKVGD